MFGASTQSSFYQNVPEFSNAKPEANQREAGADPGHEGSVSGLASALFGEIRGSIFAGRRCVHSNIHPRVIQVWYGLMKD